MEKELNFVIDNKALAVVKNTVINANFDEMKSALIEMTEPYKNLVVTEDMVGIAKTDRAKIRRVATTIDEYRKTVKRVYTQQFSVFEDKCKELTGICKEASDNLDGQIKEFEDAAKRRKMEELEFYFQSLPKKHGEYISFNDIADERWKNVTFDIDDAKRIIKDRISKTDIDVDTILEFKSPYELALLMEYRRCRDISMVLMYKARLEGESRKALAEAKTKDTEKRITHDLSPNRILIELNDIDAQTKKKLLGYLIKNSIPYREIM